MTNTISRLYQALETWSFKYNCYEAVHPWTPYCTESALDIGLTVFGEAIKLYTPLYLFSLLVHGKFDYLSLKNTSQSILRSTTFISANAFFALLFFCSSQYITGKFYYYAVAYIPGFVASSMAVMIEKPSRRSSLAFYVANVASEALFRIYVARGYLRAINHGQVYIFTLAMATIMFLAKKHGFEDDPLSAAIKTIVGSEEASKRRRRRHQQSSCHDNEANKLEEIEEETSAQLSVPIASSSDEDNHRNESIDGSTRSYYFQRVRRTYEWLQSILTSRHPLCPHPNSSCIYYVSKASLRALLIGYCAQLGLKLFTRLPQIMMQTNTTQMNGAIDPLLAAVRKTLTDTSLLRVGLFLGTFSGTYKATSCCLRWTLNESTAMNCFLASLVAGPSLLVYPSPTVALYVLWKCLEALYHEAVSRKIIVQKELFIVILYGLATSQLFYSALMDPRYMKKSYMAFLDRISHHKLHLVNRAVLDVFGTEASSGYEDFFPDLHPKFMSQAFMGSIWIWMIEQKFVSKAQTSSP